MTSIRLDLLSIFGSGYVVEHCIAVFRKKAQEKIYRAYITDALKAISQNTAAFNGQGLAMSGRFAELAGYIPKADEMTGDEIVADIIARAGLRTTE